MPLAFLILGIIAVFLTIFSCFGMATNSAGITSLIYFLLTIVLISLEIGLGSYFVHIESPYAPPLTSITTTTKTVIVSTSTRKMENATTVTETTTPSSPFSSSSSFPSTLPSEFFPPNPLFDQPNKSGPNKSSKTMSASFFKSFERNENWRSIQLEVSFCYIKFENAHCD